MYTISNFYKSKEWEKLVQVLKLERVNSNGELICEHCGKPIDKKYDCIAHHKIELTEGNVNNPDIAFNSENIMLIHFKCHNKIHERFGGSFRQKVYIVYGSPCSGKSSWVKENAYPDDLIIDIDRIWECICLSDRENKPNRLKQNMFGIRDALLDQVKTRTGKWRNAWVIGGYPLASDRKRLSDLLNAELIFVDTSKQLCLDRCPNEDWKKYVEEWFSSYC